MGLGYKDIANQVALQNELNATISNPKTNQVGADSKASLINSDGELINLNSLDEKGIQDAMTEEVEIDLNDLMSGMDLDLSRLNNYM